MTRHRSPATHWRIKVDDWVGRNGDGPAYGTTHHIGSHESGENQPGLVDYQTLPGSEFDELVVGGSHVWLHVEQMGDRSWWMDVGGVVIWIELDRDGRPKSVDVHMPPSERDPEPGCTYEVTGGLSDLAGTVNTDTPHQEKR